MWAAIGLACKFVASGAWRVMRSMPWWFYALAVVAIVSARWHVGEVREARAAGYAAGDADARRKLAVPLMQAHADAARNLADMSAYYTQASQAEGRALEFERGLNRCIGTRTSMDLLTSAVLRGREQQRVAAVAALTATQRELSDAYATTADRCADQPVPDPVIRVLDAAAFGPASGTSGADSGSRDTGPAVRARTVIVDGSDAGTGPTGTTYRDLAGWVAEGWAPALDACNADKAAIANLRIEAKP